MTKVSKEIMDEVQEILHREIPKNLHPVFATLVRIIVMLVGSDDGMIETIVALETRIAKLEVKHAKLERNELQNRK
jgi:hypothetical protein